MFERCSSLGERRAKDSVIGSRSDSEVQPASAKRAAGGSSS